IPGELINRGLPRAGRGYRAVLLRFLVRLMLVATRAVLLVLHAFRMKPLVLRLVVVPLFALGAGEDDLVAHSANPALGVYSSNRAGCHAFASTAFRRLDQ